jgi:hypothetical protein
MSLNRRSQSDALPIRKEDSECTALAPAPIATIEVLQPIEGTEMSRNIVVYSDGTGQDGGVRPEQRVSNVYKMYRASRVSFENAIDPAVQVTMYDPGLGTDIGATAMTAPIRFIQKLLASVDGRGILTNIADCYTFILDHYQPGDRIFLFGFSRGAYTVRSVADLLRLCGVPTKTPDGQLLRFRIRTRQIAQEAVLTVLEHGAGHPPPAEANSKPSAMNSRGASVRNTARTIRAARHSGRTLRRISSVSSIPWRPSARAVSGV